MVDKILFLDDEISILKSLTRLFMDEPYEIFAIDNPAEALKVIEEHEVAVVVSDQRMPEMEGAAFLEKVKEIRPDTVRMILTGHADLDAAVAAVNQGAICRFMTKPWDDLDVKMAVKNGAARYRLISENRRLGELTKRQNEELRILNEALERKVEERTAQVRMLYDKLKGSFNALIRVSVELMGLFNPWIGSHVKRVASLATELGKQMELEENSIQILDTAALLHNIGLIGIPRALLQKDENDLTAPEMALIRKHPVIGYTILNPIEDLKQVSVIVRSVHENFDGSGYPDQLKTEAIPPEARIIRVVNDYDTLVNKRDFTRAMALERLRQRSGYEYDPDVVIQFMELLKRFRPVREREIAVPFRNLKAGMVLCRPIRTKSGRVLLGEGQRIVDAYIERMAAFNEFDPIAGLVYVCRQNEDDE